MGDEKPGKSAKSDFFDGNSPLRKKTKKIASPVLSDDEVRLGLQIRHLPKNFIVVINDFHHQRPHRGIELDPKHDAQTTRPRISFFFYIMFL